MSKYIEALLIERAGYEMRGLKDRVAQIDEQLSELGVSHKYLTKPQKTVVVEEATIDREIDIEVAAVRRGRKPKSDYGDS